MRVVTGPAGLHAGDPTSIGPYRLLARVGAGGMGTVYLGEDGRGRHVAVKMLRQELADDAELRRRFRREVEAARLVTSPFVARLVNADLDGPRPWLATEHIVGSDLAKAVSGGGPLAGEELVCVARDLAQALNDIHRVGVVHRDVKPANVLLGADGAKLVDFGIARAADATQLTRAGVVLGSPGFLAPEQVLGKEVAPPADVFSWAATVAYAATGRPPFGEGPTDAVLYRVVHAEPDLVGLAPPLAAFVGAGLAKDPGRRPATRSLLEGLGVGPAAAPGPPTTARLPHTPVLPPPLPALPPPPARQRSRRAATARLPHTPVLPPPAPPPVRRRRGWRRRAGLVARLALLAAVAGAGAVSVGRALEDRAASSPPVTAAPARPPQVTEPPRRAEPVEPPTITTTTLPDTLDPALDFALYLRLLTTPLDAQELPEGFRLSSPQEPQFGLDRDGGAVAALESAFEHEDLQEEVVLVYRLFTGAGVATASYADEQAVATGQGEAVALSGLGGPGYCVDGGQATICSARVGRVVVTTTTPAEGDAFGGPDDAGDRVRAAASLLAAAVSHLRSL